MIKYKLFRDFVKRYTEKDLSDARREEKIDKSTGVKDKTTMKKEINIIGAGLAGSEAALFLARRGWKVRLYEMRPGKQTPAHETGLAAELVCSNSLKSLRLDTASGLLKAEMEMLGCALLPLAGECMVPAGQALAVDRLMFATRVQQALEAEESIELIREEVKALPDELTILATGPLTSESMMEALSGIIGSEHLYFFDAIAPVVEAQSLDLNKIYSKDRYDKGDPDYLNCPFDKDEYYSFVNALIEGEKHEAHEFESKFFENVRFSFYENCMPVEEIARRGIDSLRHGVMKPMGLESPVTGRKPFAVLQLRAENLERTSYNLVGCQTMLRYPEQKRIFRLVPGLEQAEFHRFGSIHRNTYLNSPALLNPDLSLRGNPKVYVAGQLSGVEGYVESIGIATLLGHILDSGLPMLPEETILGQLWRHLITPSEQSFQPMNANFGILPPLENAPRDKKLKKEMYSQRSLDALSQMSRLTY